MSQFVIETHGLSKAYGDLWALKSLDLRVPKNSIFAFLGPNGAGKTTAIKLLLGLTGASEGMRQLQKTWTKLDRCLYSKVQKSIVRFTRHGI